MEKVYSILYQSARRQDSFWQEMKVKITFLAILCALFGMIKWTLQRLSDLQIGDKKGTLNHLVDYIYDKIIETKTRTKDLTILSCAMVATLYIQNFRVYIYIYTLDFKLQMRVKVQYKPCRFTRNTRSSYNLIFYWLSIPLHIPVAHRERVLNQIQDGSIRVFFSRATRGTKSLRVPTQS